MRSSETFFRPEVVERLGWTMPAALYRLCQWALRHSATRCAFVPIRSMQYQAVIDAEEVIFVDALGGYRVQDGHGGRLITLSWRPRPLAEIRSLTDPVPCEVLYYRPGLGEVQRRLVGELQRALEQLKSREGGGGGVGGALRVIPLREG